MKDQLVPDWNKIWKRRLTLNRSTPEFREGADLWGGREQARRYATRSEPGRNARVAEALQDLNVAPGDRVLDIGSGPGTLALPLARAGAAVTAVDPAEGMLAELRAAAEQEGITGITTVQGLWEEIDPARDLAPPYDRVVASFSLSMPEIRSALAVMDAVASGSVYLYWFADEPLWEQLYLTLWDDLHGAPYYPRPKADCLFNILYGMGIYANVLMRPLEGTTLFATVEDAVEHFAPRMSVTTPRQRAVLRDYFREHLVRQADGLALAGSSTYASIWWQKPG
ncbi:MULTISPECIES: class I SAM-dependent methyltransferase [unclassified Methanoculleus]|uniref:class I SAM-dependent methyltransferase n=1 Tax=unclassified Methanoculleus TaxID=2619537 RepID=UPI0025FCE292|nr:MULTISPECIES: class I SAM-dependent methyltransferase [unclassified Methanoculleus]MCK9318007.1 class I SAM-dependent methyltransferase [Methanoculleus sp.]MDD2254103.1 class I SAM-dependent methyltransferase [Methanoculleus sp.]MDD2786866.1 class I SAM-dependent methyltransferase [Methanoculleus sp.]MDD3215338.1 class I SAM-dependent methyltransferase [Methanoculleus sp.]MDD4314337.1 class I SAM-dependent methyltransferase [Methanoculleus sp.]